MIECCANCKNLQGKPSYKPNGNLKPMNCHRKGQRKMESIELYHWNPKAQRMVPDGGYIKKHCWEG